MEASTIKISQNYQEFQCTLNFKLQLVISSILYNRSNVSQFCEILNHFLIVNGIKYIGPYVPSEKSLLHLYQFADVMHNISDISMIISSQFFTNFTFLLGVSKEVTKTTTGRLNNGVSQVPPRRGESDLSSFRESLPVYALREDIRKAINDHKVVLISGETGSGKTTQVKSFFFFSPFS